VGWERKISETVKKIVMRKKEALTTLVWKDKLMGTSGGTEERRGISETIEVRSSGSSRKQPVTRRDDFLWT
jgi:hypothetical protein